MTARILAVRVPRQADFDRFAEISGDDNPIHVDPDFSARTRFGRTVSHGMLLYSWAWSLLKDVVPEAKPVAAYLMFPSPSFADEEIAFVLEARESGRMQLSVRRTSDDAVLLQLDTRMEAA